jgi:hypothetical protein
MPGMAITDPEEKIICDLSFHLSLVDELESATESSK